jgi:hypothetical protein
MMSFCFFLLPVSCFLGPMNWESGFDLGVFGRFNLAALAQPHLEMLVSWFSVVPLFAVFLLYGPFTRFSVWCLVFAVRYTCLAVYLSGQSIEG